MSRRDMAARRNRFFDEIAGAVAAAAKDFGQPKDVAEQLGAAVADALATDWKGQLITVPMDHYYKLAKRDLQVLADRHAGDSVAALAKRYGLCQRAVYRLLERAETRARDRQVALFPEVES